MKKVRVGAPQGKKKKIKKKIPGGLTHREETRKRGFWETKGTERSRERS